MHLHRFIFCILALSTGFFAMPLYAADCASAQDRACIADKIISDAETATEPNWKDQILRDVSASLTYDGQIDKAIALVKKVSNPDTQAMTIRTIGMAAALYGKHSQEELKGIFEKLSQAAAGIAQPDAFAIAYTYIAMSQAFAGMDADAWATAAAMKNAALRHKAYGETAEIQAERGDLAAAMKSIGFIDTSSFRNKAYQNVAEILTKKEMFDDALKSAQAIDNPVKQAQTLQQILKAQEEKTRGPRNDTQESDTKAGATSQPDTAP